MSEDQSESRDSGGGRGGEGVVVVTLTLDRASGNESIQAMASDGGNVAAMEVTEICLHAAEKMVRMEREAREGQAREAVSPRSGMELELKTKRER